MSEYVNHQIYKGWIWANPMSDIGPYVNQWVPIRRATFMERVKASLGMQFLPSKAQKGE